MRARPASSSVWRRRFALLLRHGRRREWQPAAFRRRNELAAFPGHVARGLAAGMARAGWRSGSANARGSQRRRGRSAASVRRPSRPRSSDVIRPSGSTAVASTQSRPAPESAKCPRWIMCQSVARPLSAEYWHMGEMIMRLGRVRLRSESGENNALMKTSGSWGERSKRHVRGQTISIWGAWAQRQEASRVEASVAPQSGQPIHPPCFADMPDALQQRSRRL